MCFTFALYFTIHDLHAAINDREETLTAEDFYRNISQRGLKTEAEAAPTGLSRRKSYQNLEQLCKDQKVDFPRAALRSTGDASRLIKSTSDHAWQVFAEITDFLYNNRESLFPDGIFPPKYLFRIPGDPPCVLTYEAEKQRILERIFQITIRPDHPSREVIVSHCKAFSNKRVSTNTDDTLTTVNTLNNLINVNNALLASLPSIAGDDNDVYKKYLNTATQK